MGPEARGYRVVGTSMTETGPSVRRFLAQLAAHCEGSPTNKNDEAARGGLFVSLSLSDE